MNTLWSRADTTKHEGARERQRGVRYIEIYGWLDQEWTSPVDVRSKDLDATAHLAGLGTIRI